LSVISGSGLAAPGSRSFLDPGALRGGLKICALAVLTFAICFAVRAVLVREAMMGAVHTLVEAGDGDVSDAELTSLMADAGPGALHIASSHDPDAPLGLLGRPPAWKRLEITSPPKLWLGKLSMQEAERVNGAIPDAQVANPPADAFVLRASPAEKAAALQCLTAAIYYEAALEPREGQEAVAQVVLNRMRHQGYPKSVCGVVFQGSDRPGCQFSFACDGSMARAPVAWAWRNAKDVAEQALDGFVMKDVGTATHYHTSWVMAPWTPTLLKVTQIGAHIFFRPLGPEGDPSQFRARYLGGEAIASKVDLIGKPAAAASAPDALMRVSETGSALAPRSVVIGGRTIVMPPGTVFLSHLRQIGASPSLAVPPMHAMIAMRAAAAKAAMGTAGPTAAIADAAEALAPDVPAPKPAPPRPKPVAGPNGFETLPSDGGG
jgi:spore germination cell wall hydrolase CwlJ-like protein